ncbi:predicted protein [Uncinocarpus reesii 1704]|uniref:Protein kinase domain-containing protein n=1 Tax=Uncinocarpus reesii (strain UAMH 1704) TaxID=336963 RepID=C4JLG7_UNCRE|nr:uncharacterized protein UREG_03675 [Uncinocarpus reesii 1704]EEP78829.1 predicted protein [Uncinocarpus reesii 1704]
MSNQSGLTHAMYPSFPVPASEGGSAQASGSAKPLSLTLTPGPSLEMPEPIRVSDLPESIREEDEETASEPLEPITPRSATPPPVDRPQKSATDPAVSKMHTSLRPASLPHPLIINTDASPVSTSSHPKSPDRSSAATSPRRRILRLNSIKSMFRRRDTPLVEEQTSEPKNPSPTHPKSGIFHSLRKNSVNSTAQHSSASSQSSSPSSPASPSSTLNSGVHSRLGVSTPSEGMSFKRPTRSATGLSLRERSKIIFAPTPRPHREEPRIRSPSLGDVDKQPERPGFSIPAVSGAGLKARRMSASLPDGFAVDTCELNDEYTSSSRVPGRRGKEIGKGATATVKIMFRKGGDKDTPYAVKEFRKRGQKEDEQEYVQKVKSEFSIANSLNHPNIDYLTTRDNLCFFKQIVRGVAYLHENGIGTRDIKVGEPGYYLMKDTSRLPISAYLSVQWDTPGPALCWWGHYDPRPLDIWSCAIVYLTLHYRGNPWPSADTRNPNYARFLAGWKAFQDVDPEGLVTDDKAPVCGPVFKRLNHTGMKRLLLRMLHPDPSKRFTVTEVLNDRFFKTIECCSPERVKDPSEEANCIDAAGKGSCKLASKMMVQKIHHHFPPEKKYLPQHRFDMGEGYS